MIASVYVKVEQVSTFPRSLRVYIRKNLTNDIAWILSHDFHCHVSAIKRHVSLDFLLLVNTGKYSDVESLVVEEVREYTCLCKTSHPNYKEVTASGSPALMGSRYSDFLINIGPTR